MVKKASKLKSDAVYNHADNMVMVKTDGDEINVICNSEEQMDQVVERLTTDTCLLAGYEEWDDDEDKKWILKFLVCDSDYVMTPEFN